MRLNHSGFEWTLNPMTDVLIRRGDDTEADGDYIKLEAEIDGCLL